MADATPKSVVVLGATASAGRAIASEFARRGYAVVVAGPEAEEVPRIAADLRVRFQVPAHPLLFDATDYDSHAGVVASCVELLGGVPEGVVLCFGYMAAQEAAQKHFALAKRTIDINLTGAISLLERFAALFETRGGGFIAALSSVAGDRGRATNYIYGAAKAGLTAYLSGLRNRLYKAGVQVTTVKPGFMDTQMTWGLKLPPPLTATPEQAARAIVSGILRGRDEIYVLWMWRHIMLLIRNIPEWQFKKMRL
jgi:short-subunit dehydrogenase